MVEKDQNSVEQYQAALIIGVGALLTVVVLGVFVGRPLWNGMIKSQANLKEKNQILAQEDARLANLKNLSDKEQELKDKNQKVLAALPEGKDVSRLFVEFENIAKADGLSITGTNEGDSGQPQAQTASSAPKALIIPVSYTITGDANGYGALKNVLAKFEQALRLVSVQKINIISGTTGVLNTNIELETYTRGSN